MMAATCKRSESCKRARDCDAHAADFCKLMAACLEGKTSEVDLLLTRGTDIVNRTDMDGRSALMAACDNQLIFSTLIKAGADVNHADKDGITVLMMAVWKESEPLVNMLLENGADVRAETPSGWTAADFATYGDGEVLKILVGRGAKINPKNALGSHG